MELIRFVLGSSRRAFLLAVGAGMGSGLSMVGLLAMTNHILHHPEQASWITGGIFAALVLSMVLFRVNSTVLLAKLSQQNVANLRMQLCHNILQAPLAELEKQGGHKLLATLSEDVNTMANGIMRLPFLCINVAVITGCLVYMLWLSWWLCLLALIFVVLGVVAYRLPEARALKRLSAARAFGDELYAGFQAVVDGAKELKMHRKRRETFLSGPMTIATQNMQENTVAATRYYSFAGSMGIFLFFVIIGSLIFIAPKVATISSAALVGYVMVFLFIQGPMEIVVNAIPDLAKADVGLKKIEQLGLSLSQKRENAHASKPSEKSQQHALQQWQTLTLHNVTHSYYREQEDSHFQLGPINMSFRRGELVFLIGGNGSGKTTFAKLLLGLYVPEAGHIKLDDNIINANSREDYRQTFSSVFVDFYLFEQLLGLSEQEDGNANTNTKESASDIQQIDELAQRYIEHLQLSHKVSIQNGQLSTVKLSQGQKKRLALLTAYLEDRDFYLFDEWAADQDPVFKRVFYTQILPDLKAKGKTVLVISHDDQYFHIADRYIRMDGGKATMSNDIPNLFAETGTENQKPSPPPTVELAEVQTQ